MLVVTLKNLDQDCREEILEQLGRDSQHEEYLRGADVLENGRQVCAICMAVDTGDNLEHCYFDIVAANGMQFSAVSGYHLDGIEAYRAQHD